MRKRKIVNLAEETKQPIGIKFFESGTSGLKEFSMLKTAAMTTLIGVLRDTLQQSMPSLSREYDRLRAEHAGEAPATPHEQRGAERAVGAGQFTPRGRP